MKLSPLVENENTEKLKKVVKLFLRKTFRGIMNGLSPKYEVIITELTVVEDEIMGKGYLKAQWANGEDYYPDRNEYFAAKNHIAELIRQKIASYINLTEKSVFIHFDVVPWETDLQTLK